MFAIKQSDNGVTVSETCLNNFGKGEIGDPTSNSETGYFFLQWKSDDLIEIECKSAALIMI